MSMPTVHKVVALTALLYLLSCQADPETWQRGKALACDSCTSDLDCAAGLLCDQDAFACKSVDQLKAKKVTGQPQCDADCWKECYQFGNCRPTVRDGLLTCLPGSVDDCASSLQCKTKKIGCNFDPKAAEGKFPYCVQ